MMVLRCVLIVAVLVSATLAAQSILVDVPFKELKEQNDAKIAVFYYSSEPESASVLSLVNRVGKKLSKTYSYVRFVKVDGDDPINVNEFKEAGFTHGTNVFTQTPEAGITKYMGELKPLALYDHFKSLMDEPPANLVAQFTTEDEFYDRMDLSDSPRPQFVKFFEQWCTHCKAARRPFAHAAYTLRNRVDFVEVECSKSDDSTAFCQRHGISGYPGFKLFTSEEQIAFQESERSKAAFIRWLEDKLPEPETIAVESVLGGVGGKDRAELDRTEVHSYGAAGAASGM